MKGKEGKAREHLLPLTTTAQEIIASLPRFKNGPYLFSLSAGSDERRVQSRFGPPHAAHLAGAGPSQWRGSELLR
jgi:hypothetical protein